MFVCSFVDLKCCKICINLCRPPKIAKIILLCFSSPDLLCKNIVLHVAVTENWLCFNFEKVS
jgi:hypothetical protein